MIKQILTFHSSKQLQSNCSLQFEDMYNYFNKDSSTRMKTCS